MEAANRDEVKYAYAAMLQLFLRGGRLKYSKICKESSVAMKDFDHWNADLIEKVFKRLELSEDEQFMIKNLPEIPLEEISDISSRFLEQLKPLGKNFLEDLMLVMVSSGSYDARHKSLLQALLCLVCVDDQNLGSIEESVTSALIKSKEDLKDTQEHIDDRAKKGKYGRMVGIGLAAIGGGVLIGLTGGLAAPLVGTGLASLFGAVGIGGTAGFFGSVGGVALITSLFGVTGAGMGSFRMAYRNRGVKELFFITIAKLKGIDEIKEIEGTSNTSIWSSLTFWKKKNDSEKSPTVTNASSPTSFEADENTKDTHSSPEISSESGDIKKSDSSIVENSKETSKIVDARTFFDLAIKSEEIESTEGLEKTDLSVTVTISGWITSLVHVVETWKILETEFKQNLMPGEVFSLCWETKELMALARVVEQTLSSEVVSIATTQVLSRTLIAGLMSAIAWPASLLKVGAILDNPWAVAMERAKKSGFVLADVLKSFRQGKRPVTLIGTSLGARIIFFCLLELARSRENSADKSAFSIVSDVYLLGAPVSPTAEEWKQARSVVSGRFVNGYCSSDWVLGFLMRAGGGFSGVAGLGAVSVGSEKHCTMFSIDPIGEVGIQNVNLTSVITGHMGYRNTEKVKQALEIISKCTS